MLNIPIRISFIFDEKLIILDKNPLILKENPFAEIGQKEKEML